MMRKSAICSISLPESSGTGVLGNDVSEQESSFKKRQQFINFGHSQWGINNWSWSVTKQDLDFADYSNGKFSAGVAAFVTITVNSLGIHRADVGYATSVAAQKGSAIHQARKSSVTNALRETLFSFGGNIATCLSEYLELSSAEEQSNLAKHENEEAKNKETDSNSILKQSTNLDEPKNSNTKNSLLPPGHKKELTEMYHTNKINGNLHTTQSSSNAQVGAKNTVVQPLPGHLQQPHIENNIFPANQIPLVNKPTMVGGPPANHIPAKGRPIATPHVQAPVPPVAMPPPPAAVPTAQLKSNPNVSFLLQPVMSGMMQPFYSMQCTGASHPPPTNRTPFSPAHVYSNAYFTDYVPWHLAFENYDRHHGNVNLNFNIPPKNLIVNGRPGPTECKNVCGFVRPRSGDIDRSNVHNGYSNHQTNANWIKPSIFYDGFWTEQNVKKWVSEQTEKPSPSEDPARNHSFNPAQNQPCHPKI